MSDTIKQLTNLPETVQIGEHTVNLRLTKRAMYYLNLDPIPETAGAYAHTCQLIWAMARAEEGKDTPFKEPADVADHLDQRDAKLMSRIASVVEQGQKYLGLGGEPDPLSESGPSQDNDSD